MLKSQNSVNNIYVKYSATRSDHETFFKSVQENVL